MNRTSSLITFAAALALAASVRAADAGYVDLGKFKSAENCQYVEVNVGAPLLKFAAIIAGHHDKEAAALIRDLKHVRVNVVGYDESNRAETLERVQGIRRDLEAQGWVRTVTARTAGQAEDVAVYVKMAADDSIEGVVVTVLDGGEKQAVVVNVVGNIKPEQIAKLGRGLNLDCLTHLPATDGKGA